MGVHSDTVPLICGVCLKVFPDMIKLSSHVRSNHWPLTNGDFSCDICGRPYSNKSKMSRHRKIHGLDVDALLNNGAIEPANETLSSEKNLPVAEVELTCEMCTDLTFYNWETLCNHRRLMHGLFPCDLCNKCYGRTSHLWKHVNRVHKGHKDVTCRYCMKTSASKDHLAAHIAKIHRYEPDSKLEIRESTNCKQTTIEDEGVHHCDKCNKGFHKRYLLRRHMKGCQNYRKDPGALLTRCRACERIFKDRASLQKHIENHHSTYTCHLCDETVTSKLGIMTHNRVKHMDHPDLTCDNSNCKKLFRTKEDLESHRKDHKYHSSPNVCDFCGDTVENKLKLKMHVLSLHRNEIGVSCGVCLIPMKDPKDLKKHVEDEHTGVLLKPNTCQVCGKQYASKWKAFDHTKKCHGKVFRTCKQCLAVFTTDSDIRYHYEHIHNVPKDQLAGFEKRLDIRPDDFDNADVVVKEEPEDYEYENGHCDDEVYDYKRRRNTTDTYDCDMCPEIFLNRDTLSDHYRNVHNKDPQRMFKKIKLDHSSSKRKMRSRENFECKNCGKQFCTKTLFWNHINVCTRRNTSSREDSSRGFPTSILEAHLKNNNKIKKEPLESALNESNLNIPDFNLFEDINMQLSEQKPVPNLMPLSQLRLLSSMKCSRKDSRKVYDESTNTECTCEVCGKQWPAKKHLWQHLIRFHRAEAAVTCGVCLKLCRTYEELADHLKASHESILGCEGNNFTCKTCGRYHNARSKLLLHMSIHINSSGIAWCRKCEQSFESEEKLNEHSATCDKPQPDYEDQSNDADHDTKNEDDDDKGSLIGDGASLTGEGEEEEEEEEVEEVEEEEEEVEFSDHHVESNSEHSEDSDSSSSSSSGSGSEDENDEEADVEEIVSRTNSRATGEQLESEDERDSEDYDGAPAVEEFDERVEGTNSPMIVAAAKEMIEKDMDRVEEKSKDKDFDDKGDCTEKDKSVADNEDKNNYKQEVECKAAEESDDDGPPVLSPVMPLSMEHESEEPDDVGHKLSPMIPLTAKAAGKQLEEDVTKMENGVATLENPTASASTPNAEEYFEYAASGERSNISAAESVEDLASDEDAETPIVDDENEELDDEDSRIQVVNPNDEYHSDNSRSDEESDGEAVFEDNSEAEAEEEVEEVDDVEDVEEVDEVEEVEEIEEVVVEEEGEGEEGEGEDGEEGEALQIHNLDGTVLMVANDADGNQILIQQNVSDLENDDSMAAVTGFIYEDDDDEDYELHGFPVESQRFEAETIDENEREDHEQEDNALSENEGDEAEEEVEEEEEREGDEEDKDEVEDGDVQDSNISAKSDVSRT